MKVLTATTATQGDRAGDLHQAVEGELVILPWLDCWCPGCPCTRCFYGLASGGLTTTAVIADLPHITAPVLADAIRSMLHRDGWATHIPGCTDQVDALVAINTEMMGDLPVGSISRITADADQVPPGAW